MQFSKRCRRGPLQGELTCCESGLLSSIRPELNPILLSISLKVIQAVKSPRCTAALVQSAFRVRQSQYYFFFSPMAPTLYTMDLSPPARGVLLTAAALGVELNQKIIDLGKKEQRSPEYIQVCVESQKHFFQN